MQLWFDDLCCVCPDPICCLLETHKLNLVFRSQDEQRRMKYWSLSANCLTSDQIFGFSGWFASCAVSSDALFAKSTKANTFFPTIILFYASDWENGQTFSYYLTQTLGLVWLSAATSDNLAETFRSRETLSGNNFFLFGNYFSETKLNNENVFCLLVNNENIFAPIISEISIFS